MTTPTATVDECREAFEAWATANGQPISSMTGKGYTSKRTTYCWHAWKAAWNTRDTTMKEGEGWQPIETAPRDGTTVDLWCKEGYRLADYAYTGHDGLWDCPGSRYVTDGEISHWMPIPPLPTNQKEG